MRSISSYNEKIAQQFLNLTHTLLHEQDIRDAEREEGREEERKEDLRIVKEDPLELLSDYGMVPEYIIAKINEINDRGILSKWLKMAARVQSVDEFVEKINSLD